MGRFRQGALLVLLTLVAYGPALRGGFVWDDDLYVTRNPTLRSVHGLREIWLKPGATPQYYPLTFTTLWAEYRLWGLNPLGYHVVNVLLHALNAVLLWFVLRRLALPAAWWAAAIFALHPVNVESVAWITERKNVLSSAFYFSAVLAFFRFREERRHYLLVVGLFLCALLSKTVTCTLPAALVLLIWWKYDHVEKRDWLALAPLFLLAAAAGIMTAWVEKRLAGATGVEWEFSILDRCLIAGRALWFYAGKLFWPVQLTFIYPRWSINDAVWWQYLFPATAVLGLVILWAARERIGKGPLVAALFFAGTLSPALGFVDVYPFLYSFVADHFQYLAGIGLIALAVVAATQRIRSGVLGVILLAVLGVLTWRQGLVYRDIETLWRDTLAKNPNAWMAHHNLGGLLAERGQTAEAIAEYSAALRVNPNLAETHHNLGEALLSEGAVEPAIAEFQEALHLDSTLAETHHKLGTVWAGQGKLSQAIDEYAAALRIDPGSVRTHFDLGAALFRQGRFEDAVAAYRSVLVIDPQVATAYHNLGLALANLGRMAEAIEAYTAALRLDPNLAESHHHLGQALASQQKLAEATREFNAALQLRPNYPDASYDLAEALAAQGRIPEAITAFRKAAEQALQAGDPEMSSQIQQRVKMYEAARRSPNDSR